MRYLDSSKNIQVSFIVSVLMHVILFVALYSPLVPKKKETRPITVEFYSAPPQIDQPMKAPSLKKGGVETGPKTVAPKAVPVPPPPMKTAQPPASKFQQPAKTADITATKPAEAPKPSGETPPAELPKSQTYPGIKELTPPLDKLANIGKGGKEAAGEAGSEEETVFLDSTDEKFTSYLHGVKFKIEGVWRYPEAARRSAIVGRGYVTFTIERDGTLSDLRLISSSGYPILDEEILRAIKAASPFNPMVGNMKTKRLTVVANFEYNLSVQRIWGR